MLKKFIKEISIIILVVSIPFLQELGHFIGYILDGTSATIEYGFIT